MFMAGFAREGSRPAINALKPTSIVPIPKLPTNAKTMIMDQAGVTGRIKKLRAAMSIPKDNIRLAVKIREVAGNVLLASRYPIELEKNISPAKDNDSENLSIKNGKAMPCTVPDTPRNIKAI